MKRRFRLAEIAPIKELGPQDRPSPLPFSERELSDKNISHSSTMVAKSARSRSRIAVVMLIMALSFFFSTKNIEWILLSLGLFLLFLCIRWTPLLEYREFHEWNRPDIFIGWNYSKAVDNQLLPISRFVAALYGSLKPSWGCVFAIPPLRQALDDPEESISNISSATSRSFSFDDSTIKELKRSRGVFLPALTIDERNWQESITWILHRVRAAIIVVDDSEGEGLRWEIKEAIRLLGKQRVLLVKGSTEQEPGKFCGDETSEIVVDGGSLEVPRWMHNLNPTIQGHPFSENEAKILGWCSENLPVSFLEVARRYRWCKFYDHEVIYSKALAIACLVSLATGATVTLQRWIAS